MKTKMVLCSLGQTFETDELRDRYYADIVSYIRANGIDISLVNGEEGNEDLTIAQLAGAEGVIFSSNGPVTKRVLDALPDLRLIIRYGIGLNSVDLPECTRQGRVVLYTPGFCSNELAVHALSMGLAALRNLYLYDSSIRRGVWMKGNGPMPGDPFGMTMGILGLGDSGRVLAKTLRGAFGCRVLAYDPYVGAADAEDTGAELTDLDTVFRESDMLYVMTSLTPETRHMVDAEAFSKMKGSAVVVNIARGPVIDDRALAEALRTGRIYGAGIDVFETEPVPADSVFCGLDNIIMSPHNAYYGTESLARINEQIGRMAVAFFRDRVIFRKNLANPEVLEKLSGFTVE